MDLDSISNKYKLDKNISSGCHNYIPGYTNLFENIRYNVKHILEIGIGSIENGQMGGIVHTGYKTGNSLKCWSEYFPNALIYGLDIFEHKELNTSKITTFVADQSNEKDLQNVMNIINCEVDIIIDDGSHLGEHQAFSFMFLNKFLSKNGIYVIEDVQPQNIEKFITLSIFPNDFQIFIKENFTIKYFDTRNTIGRADDFLISFTRKQQIPKWNFTSHATIVNDMLVFSNNVGGFYSNCSIILYTLVDYFNNNKTSFTIDTSKMFNIYKDNNHQDIYNLCFYQDDVNILYNKEIKLSQTTFEPQFSDYKLLNFEDTKPFIKKYFNPTKFITDKIIYLENKYNIDYNNCCGVFYRGNDKIKETTPPTYEEIVEKAFEIKTKNSNTIFIIQTDEYEFLQYFLLHFPNSIYFTEIPVINKCMSTIAIEYINKENKVDILGYYIASTFIFSKFEKIICTSGNGELFITYFRGNADGVVQYLKKNEFIHGCRSEAYDITETKVWY